MQREFAREVDAERFTTLDRMLIRQQRERADLRPDPMAREELRTARALMIDRARKLERMGLATEQTPGIWTIRPGAEEQLRALGERGDIIKTMHRALVREGLGARRGAADYRLHRDTSTTRIVGQVLDKRLADGVGFEPTVGVNPRRFSRPVP